MNPYREPSKPSSRLKEFFVNRVTRITPLTVVLAAVLIAGIALAAATQSLRVNGIQFPDTTNAPVGVFNVTDPRFGAKCDGSDDSTAIQAAITAAYTAGAGSTKGGIVQFPRGTCTFATPLNLQGMHNVVLRGVGTTLNAVNPSTGGTVLVYSGTGSTSAIQLYSSFAMTIEQMSIVYSSGSFTGNLVDFGDHGSGTGGLHLVDRVYLGSLSQALWSADAMIDLSNNYGVTVRNSQIGYGHYGVRFRSANNVGSNANRVEGSWFSNLQTAGVANAGSGCVIERNTFEPNVVGLGAPTMYPAYKDTLATAPASEIYRTGALTIARNWIGDGDGTVNIIDTGITPINGGNITANFFGGKLRFFSLNGVSIKNNMFAFTGTNITFDNTGTYIGSELSNNNFQESMTFANAPATGINRVGNQVVGATTGGGDNFTINGPGSIFTDQADGASAVGLSVNTQVAWANSSARLLSLQNNGGDKFYIRATDGAIVALNGPAFVQYVAVSGGSGFDTNGSFTANVGPSSATGVVLAKTDGSTPTTVNGALLLPKRKAVSDAAYTALSTDYLIAYTTLTAGRTVTIPAAAAGNTGQVYVIKNESAGAFAITIAPASGTIDGAASVATTAAARAPAVRVYSNGAAWFTW